MAKLMLGSKEHVINVEQGLEGTIRGRMNWGRSRFALFWSQSTLGISHARCDEIPRLVSFSNVQM